MCGLDLDRDKSLRPLTRDLTRNIRKPLDEVVPRAEDYCRLGEQALEGFVRGVE